MGNHDYKDGMLESRDGLRASFENSWLGPWPGFYKGAAYCPTFPLLPMVCMFEHGLYFPQFALYALNF